MKTIIKLTFIFLISLSTSCQSDDDGVGDPLSQLPPATQTGAGTFGCLVNGEAFIHNVGLINAFYQQVDGEFFFLVEGRSSKTFIDQIILASNATQVNDSEAYDLKCNEVGMFYAEVAFRGLLLGNDTCTSNNGILNMTTFNLEDNIASGTFEFDIIDPRDDSVIEIRDGRFDVLFTQ